jgi:hypothetical protein
MVDPDMAVFLQIGDGVIVVHDHRDTYRPMFWPATGEYVNTTYFLTDQDAVDRLRLGFWGLRVEEIAILTDGLQSLALQYASRRAHTPFFRPLFARLRRESGGESMLLRAELETWLDSDSVNQRTDDDKTLILATRRPPDPSTMSS